MALSAHVNGRRLWDRHTAMARFGAIANGGVDRQAFSEAEIAARRELLGWSKARGFAAMIDQVGHVFIRRSGRRDDLAPVMTALSYVDAPCRQGAC